MVIIVNFQVSVIEMYAEDFSPEYYNIEELLPDYKAQYQKWNDNAGYVNQGNPSELLQAFSHWTYDVTASIMMVVDLQGVEKEHQYVLTDPSIHCKESKFGETNFGDAGMTIFFRRHKCGSICKSMALLENNYHMFDVI